MVRATGAARPTGAAYAAHGPVARSCADTARAAIAAGETGLLHATPGAADTAAARISAHTARAAIAAGENRCRG